MATHFWLIQWEYGVWIETFIKVDNRSHCFEIVFSNESLLSCTSYKWKSWHHIETIWSKEANATAEICLKMDKIFDCLNVRKTRVEAQKKWFPRTSATDERFAWLDFFLGIWTIGRIAQLNDLENPQQQIEAICSLSSQTHTGLEITVFSLKEIVPFLLNHGFDYVLSEKFCLDDLENYFGMQRSIHRR